MATAGLTLEQRAGKIELPYWRLNNTFEGRVIGTFGDRLPYLAGGRVLDMGCCEGLTTEELQTHYSGSEVIGIDINIESIRKALENKRKGTFLAADGYKMPFGKNSFDLVFCMNNISFAASFVGEIDDETYRNMLEGVNDVLKEGGKLLVSSGLGYIILTKTRGGFVQGHSSIGLVADSGDSKPDISKNPLARIAYVLTGEYPPFSVLTVSRRGLSVKEHSMYDSPLSSLSLESGLDSKRFGKIISYNENRIFKRVLDRDYRKIDSNFYNEEIPLEFNPYCLQEDIEVLNFKRREAKKSEKSRAGGVDDGDC